MDALIALALFAAGGAEPALAGGPHAQSEPLHHRAEDRREPGGPPARGAARQPHAGHPSAMAGRVEHEAVRAGEPVRLNPVFFAAPLAGGVERPAPVHLYGRRGVIIIAPGPGHAPVSAGQAAAARGLPRG